MCPPEVGPTTKDTADFGGAIGVEILRAEFVAM
jgi:hypothetical protein